MAEQPQWITPFGAGQTPAQPPDRQWLGGKGASLVEMAQAGLAVPPGFVISTACCRHVLEQGSWPEGVQDEVRRAMDRLQQATGRTFGATARPLLVAVRSGAAVSMPGMMDTLLNCGLHPGLAERLPDRDRFWRVYGRFVMHYAASVADLDLPMAAAHRDPQQAAEDLMLAFEKAADQPFPRDPWDALFGCIDAVFGSWQSERAIAYRRRNQITGLHGTAVVVQAMFPSRVSGILFTRDPNDPEADRMIVEATYGLGEAVVSGAVDPDRFHLGRGDGAIQHTQLGTKDVSVLALEDEGDPDPQAPTLDKAQLAELAALGMQVENHVGKPMDLEWGLADGRFALLQSRPIRGIEIVQESQKARRQEIQRLRNQAGRTRRVWIGHNLGETLICPTTLSWDVQRHFMSGDGGYGLLYCELGYRPSPQVCREGFLELICGRVYADPHRLAGLFGAGLPMRYDLAAIAAEPRLLDCAPTVIDPEQVDSTFMLKLPGLIRTMLRASRNLRTMRTGARDRFEQQDLPPFLEAIDRERATDLAALDLPGLHGVLERRLALFNDFGAKALRPGFFGGMALGAVQSRLGLLLGAHEGGIMARSLTMGLEGDMTVEQDAALQRVARGELSMEAFLERFGHRTVGEMELAEPRWREDAGYLQRLIAAGRDNPHNHEERHGRNVAARQQAQASLPAKLREAGGSAFEAALIQDLTLAQQLLPYRETGKHYLMMAYEQVRLAVLEIGRRHELGERVFHLHLHELKRLDQQRDALLETAAARALRRQGCQRLDLPQVVDTADGLDRLGLPQRYDDAEQIKAEPIAGGVGKGVARVVRDPRQVRDLGDHFVLVCTSTDPGWTPLFERASALVVERGGILSHGAIVARDFGIPAVVCPGATTRLPEGTMIRVDGNQGLIVLETQTTVKDPS